MFLYNVSPVTKQRNEYMVIDSVKVVCVFTCGSLQTWWRHCFCTHCGRHVRECGYRVISPYSWEKKDTRWPKISPMLANFVALLYGVAHQGDCIPDNF